MNRLPVIIACSLLVCITQAFSQSPNQAQIDSFTREVESAWQANTDAAWDKLYHKEGTDQFQVDTLVSKWTLQRKYSPELNLSVKGFHDRAEVQKKAAAETPPMNVYSTTLENWDKPQSMNGHNYIPNIPIVGIFQIDVRTPKGGGSTSFMKVGLTKEGTLRFSLLRRS